MTESDHPLGIFHGNEETAGGRSIYGKWSAASGERS